MEFYLLRTLPTRGVLRHPAKMIKKVRVDSTKVWQSVLEALGELPPLCLDEGWPGKCLIGSRHGGYSLDNKTGEVQKMPELGTERVGFIEHFKEIILVFPSEHPCFAVADGQRQTFKDSPVLTEKFGEGAWSMFCGHVAKTKAKLYMLLTETRMLRWVDLHQLHEAVSQQRLSTLDLATVHEGVSCFCVRRSGSDSVWYIANSRELHRDKVKLAELLAEEQKAFAMAALRQHLVVASKCKGEKSAVFDLLSLGGQKRHSLTLESEHSSSDIKDLKAVESASASLVVVIRIYYSFGLLMVHRNKLHLLMNSVNSFTGEIMGGGKGADKYRVNHGMKAELTKRNELKITICMSDGTMVTHVLKF